MGRGYPALWSTLLSIPFASAGAYLFLMQQSGFSLPGVTLPASDLQLLGVPLMVFGAFVFVIGLYFQIVSAPSAPRLQENEDVVDSRHPSQRVALSKIIIGIPILGVAGYLLFFTLVPYVYPTIIFVVGLYFFSSGLKTYWANTLTSYYVTTQRVMKEYRFLSLRRQEIPLDKIRGVEERKSITEAVVGLGNIQVASGGGGGSVRIVMRNVGDSTGFADELRNLMS